MSTTTQVAGLGLNRSVDTSSNLKTAQESVSPWKVFLDGRREPPRIPSRAGRNAETLTYPCPTLVNGGFPLLFSAKSISSPVGNSHPKS